MRKSRLVQARRAPSDLLALAPDRNMTLICTESPGQWDSGKVTAVHSPRNGGERRRRRRSEGEARFDAAFVGLDRLAEAAVVIEPEGGAARADHIDAGRDDGNHVVGRRRYAERADA
jgi:hypothetical protein